MGGVPLKKPLFFPFFFCNLFKGCFAHPDDVLDAHFNNGVLEAFRFIVFKYQFTAFLDDL